MMADSNGNGAAGVGRAEGEMRRLGDAWETAMPSWRGWLIVSSIIGVVTYSAVFGPDDFANGVSLWAVAGALVHVGEAVITWFLMYGVFRLVTWPLRYWGNW
jgi:hypothetical protein